MVSARYVAYEGVQQSMVAPSSFIIMICLCVLPDDIGDVYKRQVDNLSIASTLEVEYAVVIPAVLIITDEETLWIC